MELLPLKDKQISLKITEEKYEKLQAIADGDARSVSSTVRLLILKLIKGEISVRSTVKGQILPLLRSGK